MVHGTAVLAARGVNRPLILVSGAVIVSLTPSTRLDTLLKFGIFSIHRSSPSAGGLRRSPTAFAAWPRMSSSRPLSPSPIATARHTVEAPASKDQVHVTFDPNAPDSMTYDPDKSPHEFWLQFQDNCLVRELAAKSLPLLCQIQWLLLIRSEQEEYEASRRQAAEYIHQGCEKMRIARLQRMYDELDRMIQEFPCQSSGLASLPALAPEEPMEPEEGCWLLSFCVEAVVVSEQYLCINSCMPLETAQDVSPATTAPEPHNEGLGSSHNGSKRALVIPVHVPGEGCVEVSIALASATSATYEAVFVNAAKQFGARTRTQHETSQSEARPSAPLRHRPATSTVLLQDQSAYASSSSSSPKESKRTEKALNLGSFLKKSGPSVPAHPPLNQAQLIATSSSTTMRKSRRSSPVREVHARQRPDDEDDHDERSTLASSG